MFEPVRQGSAGNRRKLNVEALLVLRELIDEKEVAPDSLDMRGD